MGLQSWKIHCLLKHHQKNKFILHEVCHLILWSSVFHLSKQIYMDRGWHKAKQIFKHILMISMSIQSNFDSLSFKASFEGAKHALAMLPWGWNSDKELFVLSFVGDITGVWSTCFYPLKDSSMHESCVQKMMTLYVSVWEWDVTVDTVFAITVQMYCIQGNIWSLCFLKATSVSSEMRVSCSGFSTIFF